MISKVVVLYQPMLPEAREMASQLRQQFAALGVQGWIGSAWEEETARTHLNQAELMITLGGDGTILHAARVARGTGIPMLCVNFGKVGFLAELAPGELAPTLPSILNREFWLERRAMLHCVAHRGGQRLGEYDALNDIVVSRSCGVRVIKISVQVNGVDIMQYLADGVIVSSATGSTAYALSAGGPIMHPEVGDLLFVPICPHLKSSRALVLPPSSRVTLTVSGSYDPLVGIDGQISLPLEDGDRVEVARSEHDAVFARVRPRDYFYRAVPGIL